MNKKTDYSNEEWKIFSQEKPIYNKQIVYFRFDKKKFGAGKFIVYKDDEGNEVESWVNEYCTCLSPNPNDRWIYLPSLTIINEII